MILSWGTNPPKGQHQELFLTDRVMEKLLSLSAETEIVLPDFRPWRISLIEVTSSRITAQCQRTAVCEGRLQQRLSSELTPRPELPFPKGLSSFGSTGSSRSSAETMAAPSWLLRGMSPLLSLRGELKVPYYALCIINIIIPMCVSRL